MSEFGVLEETHLTFRLAPDMELQARASVCAVAESIRMSTDKVEEVGMAVVEACINAIEHSRAADGRLHLELAVLGPVEADDPRVLRITIQDQGVGFDPSKLVKPRLEGNLTSIRKRGWGLKIIEGLMDEVNVLSGEGGTSVVMSKAR